jgi:hypothetical protein
MGCPAVPPLSRASEERGFGPRAVELPGVAPFIGYLGLSFPSFAVAAQPRPRGPTGPTR